MNRADFASKISHMEKAVSCAPLRAFAVPHLVVDNLFPDEFVQEINNNWPGARCFQPEVRGNYIARLYRNDYTSIEASKREFWAGFNEVLWPELLAACAQVMAVPAIEIFGDLYHKVLSLDGNWPLTLMQADATYPGHEPHTHFYHCPHWAFTVLIYIDPDDSLSTGTGIHRLKSNAAEPAQGQDVTSYKVDDLDWRVDVAMATFKWHLPNRPFERTEVKYRPNRMFIFLDGPLAVHSVAFDRDFIPNLERAKYATTRGRRRILRSHVKVHHDPFYKRHSQTLPERLEPERFMRVMARDAVLSSEDQRYRDDVVRLFYRERLMAYARAAQRAAESRRHKIMPLPARPGLWDRIRGRTRTPQDDYVSQLSARIP